MPTDTTKCLSYAEIFIIFIFPFFSRNQRLPIVRESSPLQDGLSQSSSRVLPLRPATGLRWGSRPTPFPAGPRGATSGVVRRARVGQRRPSHQPQLPPGLRQRPAVPIHGAPCRGPHMPAEGQLPGFQDAEWESGLLQRLSGDGWGLEGVRG